MAYTSDISKLYSLINASPENYKEIASNKNRLKAGEKNWPAVRSMRSPPADIPSVILGEKFENEIESNAVGWPENQLKSFGSDYSKLPTKIIDVELADAASEVENWVVDELLKSKASKAIKITAADASIITGDKLTSLFSRLEEGRNIDGQYSNLLKLRRS
jgi:hypothetical protein